MKNIINTKKILDIIRSEAGCIGGDSQNKDNSAQETKNEQPKTDSAENQCVTLTNKITGEEFKIPVEEFKKMTRQEFIKKFGIPEEEANTISDEQFEEQKQQIIKFFCGLEDTAKKLAEGLGSALGEAMEQAGQTIQDAINEAKEEYGEPEQNPNGNQTPVTDVTPQPTEPKQIAEPQPAEQQPAQVQQSAEQPAQAQQSAEPQPAEQQSAQVQQPAEQPAAQEEKPAQAQENTDTQKQDTPFPYATREIKNELAKNLFGQEGPVAEDFFETVNYNIAMHRMAKEGPSIFGEKEAQQVFWYYVMRLRMLTVYFTFPRSPDDPGFLVEHLNMLSGHARNFIDQHPQEGQAIFASVIDYEEKYPYNPQKGISEEKEKIKNMTREQASKAFNVSMEEINKLSEEQFKQQLISTANDIDDVPEEFEGVRQHILKAYRNDLEQMRSGKSPEEFAAEKKAAAGITDYSIYMQAPEYFPAEIFFAEFILDPDNDDRRYAFRKLALKNENSFENNRFTIGDDKPLPHKIDLIWYSIAENKTYSLEADLPFEEMKKIFINEDRKFDSLLITLVPYGQVSLYAYNSISGKKEILSKFEAQETDVSLEDFRQSGTLYENPQNPAKDWKEYQQLALSHFIKSNTFLINHGLPNKDFNFWNDISFDNIETSHPLPAKDKINELDENGETPLIRAIGCHEDLLVTQLLQAGADVNIVSQSTGKTALSLAASMGHAGHVKQLIAAGANIEQPEGQSGMTPLMNAAQLGNEEIVRILVEAGADVNAKQFMYGQDIGYNALKYAREAGKEDIANFLVTHGAQEPVRPQAAAAVAPMTNSLDQALMAGNVAKVKEFLANGANPNTLIPGVGPALLFACTLGNAEIVQALADAKADVNGIGETTGFTPIMMAAQMGKKDIVEILIKAGADVNIPHKMNGQPSGLDALKFAQNSGFTEIAEMLKAAGAKE